MNINLESLDYGTYYFTNNNNDIITRIFNEMGYINTTITEYRVNESGIIFESINTISRIDISPNTIVQIDGINETDSDQFYSMQSAYYSQDIRL